ncbi:MAG: DUF3987 domain-containing protein [Prevotella sp.]|jgi:hypothetical protein
MGGKGINPDALEHIQQIPIYALSPNIQGIITEHAKVLQCAQDVVTGSVFSAAASAMLSSLTIDTRKYVNPPIIWVCMVMQSGGGKSQAMRRILQPLNDWDVKLYHEDQVNLPSDGSPVKERQLLIEDTSAEGLIDVLAKNPNGILLARDEIKGFFDDQGRYNDSGIISHLLSIWDGKDVRINRKTQRRVVIEHPQLNILGGIQDEMVHKTFSKSEYTDTGFLPRWLFIMPKLVSVRYNDAVISPVYTNTWRDIVEAMIKMPPRMLTMSPEAHQLYVDFFNCMQLLMEGEDAYMYSVYSKIQIIVLRWCAVAHMLSSRTEDLLPQENVVSGITMKYSIDCMKYFLETQRKMHHLLFDEVKSELTDAELIVKMWTRFCQGRKDISIKQVADILGKSRQYVSRVLHEKLDPRVQVAQLRGCAENSLKGTNNADFSQNCAQPATSQQINKKQA